MTRWLAPCLLLLARAAQAEDAAEFRPGNAVTPELRGEVQSKRRPGAEDGVYGRFDGDTTFSIGAGAEFDQSARAAVVGRALYYHSAGLCAGYSDALGQDRYPRRVGFVGVELRPLFLPRWALDLQTGSPLFDLTLDSLSLGAAAYFAPPGEANSEGGNGVQVSLGLSVPLFAQARGLWLEARGMLRPGLGDANLGGWAGISWYETWISPLLE